MLKAQAEGVRLGDMAVLAPSHRLVRHYLGVPHRAGVPVVRLDEYDGTGIDQVKVGTFKRAKGLEFARVFLRQVAVPGAAGSAQASAAAERFERERREYFVGMTRARDALWVGFVPPN